MARELGLSISSKRDVCGLPPLSLQEGGRLLLACDPRQRKLLDDAGFGTLDSRWDRGCASGGGEVHHGHACLGAPLELRAATSAGGQEASPNDAPVSVLMGLEEATYLAERVGCLAVLHADGDRDGGEGRDSGIFCRCRHPFTARNYSPLICMDRGLFADPRACGGARGRARAETTPSRARRPPGGLPPRSVHASSGPWLARAVGGARRGRLGGIQVRSGA